VAVGDSYLRCAQQLATSVRHWHPGSKICLVTDQTQAQGFDYVQVLKDVDYNNVWANDWQIHSLTPFRETLRLEADIMIVSAIEHWWPQLRLNELCISTGCRDWLDQPSTSRYYRRVFDENHLPDVYNAITYWRRSQLAVDFFALVKDIFQNWPKYQALLRFCDEVPSTDLVYAMAAQILGPERVTQPWASFPKIIHMKQHIAHTQWQDWTKELVWEHIDGGIRINTVSQWGAFHYQQKHWQP